MKYIICFFVFAASSTITFSQKIRIKDSKGETPATQPLYVVDEKVLSSAKVIKDSTGAIISIGSLKANEIQSIAVLKGEYAVEKYGEAGKNGVVVFTTVAFANKKH